MITIIFIIIKYLKVKYHDINNINICVLFYVIHPHYILQFTQLMTKFSKWTKPFSSNKVVNKIVSTWNIVSTWKLALLIRTENKMQNK